MPLVASQTSGTHAHGCKESLRGAAEPPILYRIPVGLLKVCSNLPRTSNVELLRVPWCAGHDVLQLMNIGVGPAGYQENSLSAGEKGMHRGREVIYKYRIRRSHHGQRER